MRQCRPEARQMPPEDCPLSGIWSADRAFPTLRRRDSNAFNWRDRGLLFRHRDVRFQRTAKSGSVADMGAQTCRLACLLGCPLMEFRCGRLNDRNGGAKLSLTVLPGYHFLACSAPTPEGRLRAQYRPFECLCCRRKADVASSGAVGRGCGATVVQYAIHAPIRPSNLRGCWQIEDGSHDGSVLG